MPSSVSLFAEQNRWVLSSEHFSVQIDKKQQNRKKKQSTHRIKKIIIQDAGVSTFPPYEWMKSNEMKWNESINGPTCCDMEISLPLTRDSWCPSWPPSFTSHCLYSSKRLCLTRKKTGMILFGRCINSWVSVTVQHGSGSLSYNYYLKIINIIWNQIIYTQIIWIKTVYVC